VVSRRFWLSRISEAWQRHSIVSVIGARGVGKTKLALAAADSKMPARAWPGGGPDFLDCSAPAVRELLARPEAFLKSVSGRTLIVDQIGRLGNASEFLELAAYRFPEVRILATAAAAIGETPRKSALTPAWLAQQTPMPRTASVWLTPMTMYDLEEAGVTDIRRRMLHGGLPELLLAPEPPGAASIEAWVDAFWARDVQEQFRLERGPQLRRLFAQLMAQSGGMFEAARLAKPCGASRTTISNYLAALESAFAVHVVRPYAGGGRAEIVSAPKVYGFDTAFVCHYRGATRLRPMDLGPLWEHLVLNELNAHVGRGPIRYWRTKHGTEIDFVLVRPGRVPVAVECCWAAEEFQPTAMRSFRSAYPGGASFVVTADTPDGRSYEREYGPLRVRFVSARDLVRMYQGG